jgi:MFS family permease
VFAATTAAGMATIVLPRFVVHELNGADVAVGVAIAASAPGAIAGRVLGGRLTDRYGAAAVLRWGLVLAAASTALLLVTRDNFSVWGTRAGFGLGLGLVLVAGTTWVVRMAAPEVQGRAVTHVGIAIWGGFTAGAIVGEVARSAGGFDAVWAVATALVVAPVLLVRRSGETTTARDRTGGNGYVRAALLPALGLTLTSIAQAGVAAFLILHLGERGVSHPALVFTAIGASLVACRVVLASLPDKLGGGAVAVGAGLSYGCGIAGMALATSLPLALVGAVITGSGLALQFPALALLVVKRVPANRTGAALGIYSTGYELGTIVGGPALGAIAALAGHEAALLAAAAAGVGSGLVGLGAAVSAARPSALPTSASPSSPTYHGCRGGDTRVA